MLKVAPPRRLGGDEPRLSIGVEPGLPDSWAGRRWLYVDGKPGFELSFPCGTCQFLFRREGSPTTYSLDEMSERLTAGLDDFDETVIASYAALLPDGDYVPMLLTIEPALVFPGKAGDYFDAEQVQTWGIDAYSGLPMYPGTPYYRTFETIVDDNAHLYEFVVPLQPPSWNIPDRVEEFRQILTDSDAPTCVAVAVLDICTPASTQGEEWYGHWCLAHFLLDGHHKIQAAAQPAAHYACSLCSPWSWCLRWSAAVYWSGLLQVRQPKSGSMFPTGNN